MSSRALRRAQKEQEERELAQKLAQLENEESESDGDMAPKPQPKPSLFAMLGDAGDDEDDDDEEEEDEEEAAPKPVVQAPAPTPSKKSKRKKKKKSKTATPQKDAPPQNDTTDGLDEIDQALLALNMSSTNKPTDEPHSTPISDETLQLCAALAIDSAHLHAANEMKKLFGRTALQHADDDEPRRPQGIAARVNGRTQPGSRLTGLSLRRNIFIQGKEEWPRATSGGLGMEVVSRNDDGTIEYRFVHSTAYQETQRQFHLAVASYDPERMVQLLHSNPYHIATLLQVSEIAKQQRDNASASDLLERALFTFGRSVHSTFSASLAAGKARLDFARPENREFYLAAHRYIATLCVRATFRTALEWTRLLLSLGPEQDPYCTRLVVDQLALRGRAPELLLSLTQSDTLERAWKIPPNIAFSTALAHLRLKDPVQARASLKNAIRQYPWLAARLCKELDIPLPKPIWGKEPHDDTQELLTRLYAPRAKDLWNTTEASGLLVEVSYSAFADEPATDGQTHEKDPYWLAPIPPLDLARHTLLTDDPSLISLLPPSLKELYTSTSDPLPPPTNLPSYSTSSATSHANPDAARTALLAELEGLRAYFQRIDISSLVTGGLTEDNLVRALEEAGSSLDEFREMSERFRIVREGLGGLGVRVVFEGDRGADLGGEGGTDEDSGGE